MPVIQIVNIVPEAYLLQKESINNICTTEKANCYTLGPGGIMTRCVIACGARNISQYKSILEINNEYFFDLKKWRINVGGRLIFVKRTSNVDSKKN